MELTKDAVKLVKVMQKHVSDDQTRQFMCNFYYDADAEKFVATDGRTMMLVHKSKIANVTESGYYDLAGNQLVKIDNGGQFPNWRRVYPDYTSSSFDKHAANVKKNLCDIGRLNALLATELGIWMNIEMLKKLPEGSHDLYVEHGETKKAIVFTPCPSIEIVLMPMACEYNSEILCVNMKKESASA